MLRVGLVGVGGWGKNHARVLSELGALACVCDVDSAKAEEYGKKYNVPYYTSVDDMVSREKISVAHVCTPTTTHYKVSKKLLEAGLHVFIEKPIAASVKEGTEIAELAEKMKRLVGVGYIERFNPAVIHLKKIITQREVGDLLVAEFYRENRWAGVKDVGILLDTSVHDIDTARYIFSEEPYQVFCRTGKVIEPHDDFAVMMLSFKRSRTAILVTNWVTPKKERRLSAILTQGVVRLDFVTREVKVDTDSGSATYQHQSEEPLKLEISSFIEAVESGKKPAVDARDAIKTSAIAEAAAYSSRKGMPVNLEL
ncbi:MAG: Gfo/Idh/MocA family oxidoreductase [Conexivisphaerales archaeon]